MIETDPAEPPRPRVSRRTWFVALVGLLVLLVMAASMRLFVWPDTDSPRRVDAVVVFGGSGARAEQGVELVRRGFADTVVFASAYVEELEVWAVPYCNFRRNRVPGEVVCFEPEPATTRGEARTLASMASEQGWDDVMVVVATEQVTRARMLIGRCWAGNVWMIDVASDQPRLFRVAYEWGAMVKALVVNRGC